jgi:hypothetical protein
MRNSSLQRCTCLSRNLNMITLRLGTSLHASPATSRRHPAFLRIVARGCALHKRRSLQRIIHPIPQYYIFDCHANCRRLPYVVERLYNEIMTIQAEQVTEVKRHLAGDHSGTYGQGLTINTHNQRPIGAYDLCIY